MSLLIPNLNLKKDYGLCILTINGEFITASGKHIQTIQIPTPHGRLIDADKLFVYDFRAEQDLDNAPTIVPEEK